MMSSEGNTATVASAAAKRPNYFVPTDSTSANPTMHFESLKPPAFSSLRQRQMGPKKARRRRKSGELWKLPESSIQGYADWIESKPEDTRTVGEQKFLQKYQWRLLVRRHKMPTETMKQYIRRLEAKNGGPSELESQLIDAFYRRRASRRARQKTQAVSSAFASRPPSTNHSSEPNESVVFWSRSQAKKAPFSSTSSSASSKSHQDVASPSLSLLWMNNLQASMSKMGLSSDKLREAIRVDQQDLQQEIGGRTEDQGMTT